MNRREILRMIIETAHTYSNDETPYIWNESKQDHLNTIKVINQLGYDYEAYDKMTEGVYKIALLLELKGDE